MNRRNTLKYGLNSYIKVNQSTNLKINQIAIKQDSFLKNNFKINNMIVINKMGD